MAGRPEFRASQGVIPFGVGAVTDFPEESLMMAGLDVWPHESAENEKRAAILRSTKVVDGRLASRLTANLGYRIKIFRSPTLAPDQNIYSASGQSHDGNAFMPFVRFPNWHFCPRCRALTFIPWNTRTRDKRLRCANERRRIEGKAATCGNLQEYKRPTLVPVRFVVACEHGHIMEFPWYDWAHSRSHTACDGGNSYLYLYSTAAAGLAGLMVKCTKCGSTRSMAGSFRKDNLIVVFPDHCPGHRPWLGPDNLEKGCTAIPQTVQRGSSNAYFARVVSSILIPPYSAAIQQALDEPEFWEEMESTTSETGQLNEKWLRLRARKLGFDEEIFIAAVKDRNSDNNKTAADPEVSDVSEEEYRLAEYKAFREERPTKEERHDFDIEKVDINEYGWMAEFFQRVVLVKKLRETRVLTGFSRLVPPDASDAAPAKLSVRTLDWLPGYAVRGEGIFLEFDAMFLKSWSSANVGAQERINAMIGQLRKHERDRALDARSIRPETVLIHTFAHIFIRQLAFECGYDSSSLRERLYVSGGDSPNMNGLLIYTASGDSEGTLGGLVRQGEPGRLEATIKSALMNAEICSSDPLCIESEGQGTYGLNLSACHACALLPETSCEEGNMLLDRALVIGTPTDRSIGFFGNMDF
jgi:hypothetical protein